MSCLVYNGKIITVLAGGKISLDFANHIKGGKTAKAYRDNPEYVDGDGNILKNCEFTSPSTAAQFVNGQSQMVILLGSVIIIIEEILAGESKNVEFKENLLIVKGGLAYDDG